LAQDREIELDIVGLYWKTAVAQAVSRRSLTDEARVTCHVRLLVDQAWTRITLALRLRVLDYPDFRFQLSLLRYLLSSDMRCIIYGLRGSRYE